MITRIELLDWGGSEGFSALEYHLKYGVWTDDRNDGPLAVRQALGVYYGQPYVAGNEGDSFARLTDISERRISSADFNHWEVELTYQDSERNENPLDDPVKENVVWNAVTRKTHFWADGTPIVNTANDPVRDGEGLEYEDNTPVVTYSLNQSSFPFVLAQAVRNAVNSTPWKGFAAGTVKVESITSERMFGGFRIGVYYAVSYVFRIEPAGFITRFASSGYNQLRLRRPDQSFGVANPIIKVPIFLALNTPIKSPIFLRADGKILEVDNAGNPLNTPGNQVAIISNYLYPRFNFNALFPFL